MVNMKLFKTDYQKGSLIVLIIGIIYTFLGYTLGESPILKILIGYGVISFGLIAYVIITCIINKSLLRI